MKDIFLPPGVQKRLLQKLGRIPRQASDSVAARLEALWVERNIAPEDQLERIDREMEEAVDAPVLLRAGSRKGVAAKLVSIVALPRRRRARRLWP